MLEPLFNKVSVLNLHLYQERDSGTGVFLRIFEKLLRTPFYKHLPKAVAQRCSVKKVLLEILQNSEETPVPEFLF